FIKQQKPKSDFNSTKSILPFASLPPISIRVRTPDFVCTVICSFNSDLGGKDANGKIDLVELKSSPTAPLTKNQKKAFPEIAESGAIVKSSSY
ncbi:hypothetical protein ACT453_14835, partial [Bacillus sp. D-CC]